MRWHDIEHAINQTTSQRFIIKEHLPIQGGSINRAYKISDGQTHLFVKTNHASLVDMFSAEVAGLEEIRASHTLYAPRYVALGSTENNAFLVLEYLNMDGHRVNDALFGQQLAAMHQHCHDQFGWWRNNTLGSTPQENDTSADWIGFYRKHRLGYQLKLAGENGFLGQIQRDGERLLADLDVFFSTYQPNPSLLHGDLWSGNYGSLKGGRPVIFDPAVYYGDRETDIAMTELFGGFSQNFYASYQESYPLDSGYQTRKTLYNLYHILNHLNLFGGSYLSQAETMMRSLLAEIN